MLPTLHLLVYYHTTHKLVADQIYLFAPIPPTTPIETHRFHQVAILPASFSPPFPRVPGADPVPECQSFSLFPAIADSRGREFPRFVR